MVLEDFYSQYSVTKIIVWYCTLKYIFFVFQLFLSFYFTCHIVSRLTVFIAILSTSEPTPLPDGTVQEPVITLFPAILLGLIIFAVHFILIAWYKHSHVPNFTSTSDPVQRFIHILVNTLVAIPYSKWDVDVPSSSDEDPMCHRTLSMPARIPNNASNQTHNGSRMLPLPAAHVPTRRQSDSMLLRRQVSVLDQPCVTFPNVSPPLMAGVIDLRAKMESLWWRDPSKEITLEDVREGCGETVKLLDEEAVANILGDVVDAGFVNKKGLYLPQKTKREYFWLFAFHLASSAAAIIIEVVNGGVRTKSGLYISWDIRLASFFLGLIFLALYYRRYHALRDLTSPGRFCNLPEYIPVVCCIKEPEPLTAAPVEAAILEQLCKPTPRGQVI